MYGTKSQSATQTSTQAKRLGSRVAAELMQVRTFYATPTSAQIEQFEREVELYLSAGYLDHVRYGFQRNGEVVFELVYTPRQASGIDDKPGRVTPGLDLTGAVWFSFLVPNLAFGLASSAERAKFLATLPFQRSEGEHPRLANGVRTTSSKQFSEDTLGLDRSLRSL